MTGETHKIVSKEKLLQAFQFFEKGVNDVEKMQLNFFEFTRLLIANIEQMQHQLSAKNYCILWHDFLFVFFQYFIALYDEFMALFTGDIKKKRIKREHLEFKHHRNNSAFQSTRATTYSGTWFTMASLDGLNIEIRRAEKSYSDQDFEALDLAMLSKTPVSDKLEDLKTAFLGAMDIVVSKIKSQSTGMHTLVSNISWSVNYMSEHLTYTIKSTGDVLCYSRKTIADCKNITSKLTNASLGVSVEKAALLRDPFSTPVWFPLSLYTRLGARQKRTVVDDDDDDDEDRETCDEWDTGSASKVKEPPASVVIKRTRDQVAPAAPQPAPSGSGQGISLDSIKKQYHADSSLLTTCAIDPHAETNAVQASIGLTQQRTSEHNLQDSQLNSVFKRSRLRLNSSTVQVEYPPRDSDASHVKGSSSNIREFHSKYEAAKSDSNKTDEAESASSSVHSRWLKYKEDLRESRKSTNRIAKNLTMNFLVVLYEPCSEDEEKQIKKPSLYSATKSLSTTIDLSWVDATSTSTRDPSQISSAAISVRVLLERVYHQLWNQALESYLSSSQGGELFQLPVHLTLESRENTESVAVVLGPGDHVLLGTLQASSCSIWCTEEADLIRVFRQIGVNWAEMRTLSQGDSGQENIQLISNNDKNLIVPKPSYSLLLKLHSYFQELFTVVAGAKSEGASSINIPVLTLSSAVTCFDELSSHIGVILSSISSLSLHEPRIQLHNIHFPVVELENSSDRAQSGDVLAMLLHECHTVQLTSCMIPFSQEFMKHVLHLLHLKQEDEYKETMFSKSTQEEYISPSLCPQLRELTLQYAHVDFSSSAGSSVVEFLAALLISSRLSNANDMIRIELHRCIPYYIHILPDMHEKLHFYCATLKKLVVDKCNHIIDEGLHDRNKFDSVKCNFSECLNVK